MPRRMSTSSSLKLAYRHGVDPVTQIALRMLLALPVFVMVVRDMAFFTRYMRGSLLEVIRQDYIRTAESKGLPRRAVILRHAMRNALLPVMTVTITKVF
mgnify:CR=1 FL=1